MILTNPIDYSNKLRSAICNAYRIDESQCVTNLLHQLNFSEKTLKTIHEQAAALAHGMRAKLRSGNSLDSFMQQYDLSTDEGITLMCLAEALLRIPDKGTADRLIRDKLGVANWAAHLGQSDSFFVNAATWALMLTGKVLAPSEHNSGLKKTLKNLLERSGEPVIRSAVEQAMKILSRQFIMGSTISQALDRAKENEALGYSYSYDMLGEAAYTAADADRYFTAYQQAIATIGEQAKQQDFKLRPSISVKLSALHPRYEFAQRDRVLTELVPSVLALAQQAKVADIAFTIDAEEAHVLDLSLDVIEAVFSDPSLQDWHGFGIALQAYQKRAWYVIDWLADLATRQQKRLPLRLVKGAYWDTEIKETQMLGLSSYPVFTRKASTDVSYLACAKKILGFTDVFYPQFATHNAHTVAAILALAGDYRDFEFQALHGMGQALYEQVVGENNLNIPCRIYAPVGSYEELLPYLVRRLLENGANTSFVNRVSDQPIEKVIADPIAKVKALETIPHPAIPLPKAIFGKQRQNSLGLDLTQVPQLQQLAQHFVAEQEKHWSAAPIVNGYEHFVSGHQVLSPSDNRKVVGQVQYATEAGLQTAIQGASDAAEKWNATPVAERAKCLEHAAELLEKHQDELLWLAIHEAGKTLPDAVAEVREAIDFCYFYASEARRLLSKPQIMPGYTGEYNELQLHGRGVIACISPWNFPLAIFVGQIAAALSTGNTVIAKPAEQTNLIAAMAVRLFHAAGIPNEVLHLLPGVGEEIGASLVRDPKIAGVIFTGSVAAAHAINRELANRPGPIVPFIAETGGQNAMIVDSSALPEQVVADVIASAFGSAGQRCSALRVLFLQQEVADKMITMLTGAMAELQLGSPELLKTDIGPVIDADALQMLEQHAERMQQQAKLIYQMPLPKACEHGSYFAPRVYAIDDLQILEREVFGPVLHIITYQAKELENVIAAINNTGYGLTFGIHSRINDTIAYLQNRIHAGNCYANRNMIGAVVGVQPFGGEGLSGTGPKAGGPHYLLRLCHERTLTINTTAAGGNATLMSL